MADPSDPILAVFGPYLLPEFDGKFLSRDGTRISRMSASFLEARTLASRDPKQHSERIIALMKPFCRKFDAPALHKKLAETTTRIAPLSAPLAAFRLSGPNVAINGFGRIGRLVARTIVQSGRDDVRIVAVNNRGPIDTAAHLYKYDSVHGRFQGRVEADEAAGTLDLGIGPVAYTRHTDPRDCEWASLDVDVVMECTGKFTARPDAALHLEAGAKRVLVSAPAKGADRTIVFGVNDEMLEPGDEVVSSASCTTNCLAPVARVLQGLCGIEQGFLTTIHAYTGDQPTLDATHSDLYRARAAATSLIPTRTGAAMAIADVIPSLKGVLDGVAMRAPIHNVSAVDLTFTASRDVTVEEINEAIRVAAKGPFSGVLDYTDEKLVSVDFNHDPHSAVFHTDQTRVMNRRFVRVLAWYDNEWGFSHRMADVAALMCRQIAVDRAENYGAIVA